MAEYEAEASQLKPLLHTWSLACEEQYYMLVPVIFLYTMRCWGSRGTAVIFTILGTLSFALAQYWTTHALLKAFYLLPSRFWEMATGGVLSLATDFGISKKTSHVRSATSYIGMTFITLSFLCLPFGEHHPGIFTLPAIAGACLLIGFCDYSSTPGKILCSPLMVSIGKVSYSLYLWHVPLFAFARIWIMLLAAGDKVLLICLSLVLSYGTYSFIETPFRNREQISTMTCLMYVLGTALLLMVWLGSILLQSSKGEGFAGPIESSSAIVMHNNKMMSQDDRNGLAWLNDTGLDWPKVETFERMPVTDNRNLFLADLPATLKPHSQRYGGGGMFSTSSTSFKALIVGDSFSMNLFNALYMHKELYTQDNIEFARYGCGPGAEEDKSTDGANKAREKIDALRFSVDDFQAANIVVFTWRWKNLYKFPQPLSAVCDLFQGLENKTIIVAGKRPEFFVQEDGEFDRVTNLYEKYLLSNNFSAAGMNRYFFEHADFFLEENALLQRAAENCSLHFLDWKSVVCDLLYKECLGTTPNGKPVYQPDGAHWSFGGFKAFGLRLYQLDWLSLRSLVPALP